LTFALYSARGAIWWENDLVIVEAPALHWYQTMHITFILAFVDYVTEDIKCNAQTDNIRTLGDFGTYDINVMTSFLGLN
jgi:hypothetical protein